MNDPFLDINRVVDRLYSEYKRYGDIIIAFDFDYTVHNFRDEDYTYERVSEMLRKWQPYAKLVVFSASQEERYPYIADYLNQNNIPFDRPTGQHNTLKDLGPGDEMNGLWGEQQDNNVLISRLL